MKQIFKPKNPPPPSDEDGFVDAQIYKPKLYDLCLVKPFAGIVRHAWWTGRFWDGLKKFAEQEVAKWKVDRYVWEKTE